MSLAAEKLISASPLAVAALLLLARRLCEHLGLPAPDVTQILTATNASRSAAYALMSALVDVIPTFARPRGRPRKAVVDGDVGEDAALTNAAYAYVLSHPGSVHAGTRTRYSDGFRRFIVELRSEHDAVDVEAFARAVHVPLGTLKDWLRCPLSLANKPAQDDEPAQEMSDEKMARIQTVLSAYETWHGNFVDFCDHVQDDLRVPYGIAFIRRILEVNGRRDVQRRGRDTKDEVALRGTFQTFFPGAQWVGDGMQVPVVVDGERFVVNLELDVDAHTAALVGASVRDEEDSAAVIEAFDDGVTTTGAAPEALLLDNKPCNHTPDVEDILDDTLLIRATPQRAQNKAHVEGAFGLFSQVLPELVIDTTAQLSEIARAIVTLVVITWARTTNHRPRNSRGGHSRVELHSEEPTAEQVEQARQHLREIAERQERARRTLEDRRRPDVLALLDEHFERLGLLDPKRNIRIAIAGYPADAIVDGIAIFEAKRGAGTLPDGVDARYLLGIVKNVAAKCEGEHLARAMLEFRLDAADRMLQPLVDAAAAICADQDTDAVCAQCVDRALDDVGPLERAFWLRVLVDVIRDLPDDERQRRFLVVSRRIYATFTVAPRDRQDALRVLADRIVPIR